MPSDSSALCRICCLVVIAFVPLFAVLAAWTFCLSMPVTDAVVAAAVALDHAVAIAPGRQWCIVWILDTTPAAVVSFLVVRCGTTTH